MSEHTKEPWALDVRGFPHADVMAENGRAIAVTWNVCSSQPKSKVAYVNRTQTDRENARRIVACVNACEGISTQDLETYKVTLCGYTYKELEKERNDLLAILQRWASDMDAYPSDPDLQRDTCAAIAKAKGGAA